MIKSCSAPCRAQAQPLPTVKGAQLGTQLGTKLSAGQGGGRKRKQREARKRTVPGLANKQTIQFAAEKKHETLLQIKLKTSAFRTLPSFLKQTTNQTPKPINQPNPNPPTNQPTRNPKRLNMKIRIQGAEGGLCVTLLFLPAQKTVTFE